MLLHRKESEGSERGRHSVCAWLCCARSFFLPAELSPNNVDCLSCLGPAVDAWSVGHVLLRSINSAYFRPVVNVERHPIRLIGADVSEATT